MKQFWQNLNDRERKMVFLAAGALLLALIYSGLYQPLHSQLINKNKILLEKQETLQWMQRVTPEITSGAKSRTISNNQLLTVISQGLKKPPFKKYPYQAQQATNGEIQLSFDNVPYLPFISWLWSLQSRYSIEIKQLFIEKTDKPGINKLTLSINAVKP